MIVHLSWTLHHTHIVLDVGVGRSQLGRWALLQRSLSCAIALCAWVYAVPDLQGRLWWRMSVCGPKRQATPPSSSASDPCVAVMTTPLHNSRRSHAPW